MTHGYEFLEEARSEFRAAVLYYDGHETGLGIRFRDEVRHVVSRLLADPFLWRDRGGYRRANCPVFPYFVAYFIRHDRIIIAAVAHAKRRPDYWKQRQVES